MRGEKMHDLNRSLRYLILSADLTWIVTCLLAIQALDASSVGPQQILTFHLYESMTVLTCAMWIVLYFGKRLAGFERGWHSPAVIAQTIVAVIYLLPPLWVTLLIFHQFSSNRLLCYLGFMLTAGFIAIRYTAHWFVDSHLPLRGRRRVIILGTGRMVRELVTKIDRHPELGMEVRGTLFPSDERSEEGLIKGEETERLRTLEIMDRLREENIDELILIEPTPQGAETEQLISTCREAGWRVRVVPQHYELYLSKAKLMEVEDIPLLSLEERVLPPFRVQVKRAIDILGAAFLLALGTPLLMFTAWFLWWNKEKSFRKELRCGQDGRVFEMYRINVDRDKNQSHSFKRFLVQFSLTELPQLLNVLKGEMSIVGPRPEGPERVKHYSMWQRQRLAVKPGLTGLAQVHGFREQHSSEEKAHFDLQYIFHWSLFLDLCLILQTAWTLVLRVVREHKSLIPFMLNPIANVTLEMKGICNADSAQSGTD